MEYQELNRIVMDERVRNGWRWGKPYEHGYIMEIVEGKRNLMLTPNKEIPSSWLPGNLKGLHVLGLASGGGQQMPVLAKMGAIVTSVDISTEMMMNDRLVAEREGVAVGTFQHDITKPLPYQDDCFDMVFMPVCLCYIKDIDPVFREIYRVLKPDGHLLTGQDNGMNYLVDENDEFTGHFPYNPLKDEAQMEECREGNSGIQFSHTGAEIMKSMIKAGFIIQDLYEDTNGSGLLHERNIPSFIALIGAKITLGGMV